MSKLDAWEKQIKWCTAQKRWDDCLEHAEQLCREYKQSACLQLAEQAYCAVLADPVQNGNMRALQGLSSLYYRDYMMRFTSKASGMLAYTNGECCQKAKDALARLLQHERQPETLYRYAQVLYRSAKDGQWKGEFVHLCRQKEQAYALYDEAAAMQEKWGAADKGLYCRTCYGLCRCGLEMFSLHSVLLEELMLLFGVSSMLYGSRSDHITRLRRLYHCLEQVLDIEQLPRRTDDLTAVIQAKQTYERSWDIYYLLGKLFDYAGQFSLCHNRSNAYHLAERYYRYACEIDMTRRQSHQAVSGFDHMYTALLTLHLRQHREDRFYADWERYHPVVGFSSEFHFMSQARWLIIKKDYAAAQHFLAAQLQDGRWSAGTRRRADVLQDLVQVAVSGSTAGLRGTYKPFQLKQLERMGQQGQPAFA